MQKPVGQGTNDHFSITLPSATVARLDEMAAARGTSRSAVVRALVIKGIERDALVERIAEAVA